MRWIALMMSLGFAAQAYCAAQALPPSAQAPGPRKIKKTPRKGSPRKAGVKAVTLDEFIQKLLSGDMPYTTMHRKVAALMGFPVGATRKIITVFEEETTDALHHTCSVTVNKTGDSGDLKPFALLLQTAYRWDQNSEDYFFRASLDGRLEKTVAGLGKVDEKGEGVRGSAVVTPKDIRSPEIRDRFQHELDFWLKGMYRKKKSSPKTP